jgi:hypothetical protein
MSARRALNLIEYRVTKNMDTKEFKKIENMMNGPRLAERLRIVVKPQTLQSGPINPPDWWEEDDDNSLQDYKKVARQLSAG